MTDTPELPYSGLTPDVVLDAMDAAGFRGDGRLLALGSYENRVYQVMRDDAPALVVKFYRPQRWSDAEIAEEHAFVAELVEREVPAVAPIASDGRTLHAFAGFRYAIYAKHGGRPPELDRDDVLVWLGRYLARIHAVGASRPFAQRPALTVETFGDIPRAFLLDGKWLPDDLLDAYVSVSTQALEGARRAFARAGDVRTLRVHG
ncbi:MAG: serine/threonine protein kinase, partial [Casimicrobiaceae bacterium]